MTRVVYLLGAGFSAPLGIPIVATFLEQSKDLYFRDPSRYSHFERVFRTIRDLSICNVYYNIDLFNIEDILSLLAMHSNLTNDHQAELLFAQYIADVVTGYTPPPPEPVDGQHWSRTLFGPAPWSWYGCFAASILGHAFTQIRERKHPNSIEYDPIPPEEREHEYAVVTLNYDVVLETIAEALNKRCGTPLSFLRPSHSPQFACALAKLHGSIDTGVIVPPTWNKTLARPEILNEWQLAHSLLSQANHIRVLGYSLPEADNYIKYLLRAAVVENRHLKTVHVLCQDPEGQVSDRYARFVKFPGFKFINQRTETYLAPLLDSPLHAPTVWPERLVFDALEGLDRAFFG